MQSLNKDKSALNSEAYVGQTKNSRLEIKVSQVQAVQQSLLRIKTHAGEAKQKLDDHMLSV